MPKLQQSYTFTDPDTQQAIGAPQRFEADTPEEMIEKLVAAHKNASVAYYQAKRTAKLSSLLSPDTEEPIQTFEEKPLSADESVRITNLLKDPRTAAEAHKLMLESTFGAPVEKIRKNLQESEVRNRALEKNDAITLFTWAHPEYVPCEHNQQLIEKWLNKQEPTLPVTRRNLELAYEALTDETAPDKLIVRAPHITDIPAPQPEAAITAPEPAPAEIVATAPPVQTEITPVPEPAPPISEPPVRPRISSSGLSRSSSTANPVLPAAPKAKEITQQEIDTMSSTEYAKKMLNPEFVKQVEALIARRAAARR